MAIKITDTIQTDRGATNELYVMITSVNYMKPDTQLHVHVKTYFSESERLQSENNTCKTFGISGYYLYNYNMETATDNAYTYAYNLLTTQLSSSYNTIQI